MKQVDEILKERGDIYGDYSVVANTSQAIKSVFKLTPNWQDLKNYEKESFEMVANKLARELCGKKRHDDNLKDAMGYLKLILNERGSR